MGRKKMHIAFEAVAALGSVFRNNYFVKYKAEIF